MSFDPTLLTNAKYAKLREKAAAKAAVEEREMRILFYQSCCAVLEKLATRSPDETRVAGDAPAHILEKKADVWLREVESRLPTDMRREIQSFRYYDSATGGRLVITVASAETPVPDACDEAPAQAEDAPPTRDGKRARKAE